MTFKVVLTTVYLCSVIDDYLLDHILTLQHSLNYYERMLSESHPIYLSQLRTNFVMSQSEASKNLVFLTSGSMAVLCMQALLGE